MLVLWSGRFDRRCGRCRRLCPPYHPCTCPMGHLVPLVRKRPPPRRSLVGRHIIGLCGVGLAAWHFVFAKGKMRGGGTAPPGQNQAKTPRFSAKRQVAWFGTRSASNGKCSTSVGSTRTLGGLGGGARVVSRWDRGECPAAVSPRARWGAERGGKTSSRADGDKRRRQRHPFSRHGGGKEVFRVRRKTA